MVTRRRSVKHTRHRRRHHAKTKKKLRPDIFYVYSYKVRYLYSTYFFKNNEFIKISS
jgi:hypothetical protein